MACIHFSSRYGGLPLGSGTESFWVFIADEPLVNSHFGLREFLTGGPTSTSEVGSLRWTSSSASSSTCSSASSGWSRPGSPRPLRSLLGSRRMREIISPLAWFLCIVGSTEYVGWRAFPAADFDIPVTEIDKMPAAWSRRYYRRTPTHGWEVAVIRKGIKPREWLVLTPDGSVRGLDLGHRASCRASPDGFEVALDYQPLPVLSDERRQEIMDMATAQVEQRRVSALPLFGTGSHTGTRFRRWLSVAGSMPVVSSAWVRWGLRSRARFAAMTVVVYFIYDLLERFGLFDSLQSSYQSSVDMYTRVRALVAENYESVADGLQTLEDVYVVVKSYVDPQRLVSYMFSAVVLWWALREIKHEAPSRNSSPGGSPASTSSSTPPVSPRSEVVDAGMRALSDGFLKQQEILSRLADSQERLESRIAEVAQDRRADALLQEARGPSQSQPEHSSPLLEEIKSRLESFEAVLRKDQRPGSPIPDQAASEAPKPDAMSPGHSHET